MGGVLYQKAGYAGVFGISFAILAIDFIMRLLVIEKKVAARYETKDLVQHSPNQNRGPDEAAAENGETEETPLLPKKELDYYKISPNQSAFARKFKLLPCLKHPGLVTAFFIAGIQAFLLGTFDAVRPLPPQYVLPIN